MYPILFELGSITIYSLWFFVTVGFIIGSLIFTHLCKRNRVSIDLLINKAFVLFLISLFFGRMLFVLLHHELFFYSFQWREWLGLFGLWDKGISFWGGASGFILGLYLYRKQSEESLSAIFDMLAPAVLIGMAISNFGAFLDGAFYGVPTTLPWGVSFKSAYVKYISDIHPTQIYALIYQVIAALVCLRLIVKLRGSRVKGLVAETALLIDSIGMFVVEFLRGDEVPKILSIRLSHIGAFLLMAAATYLLYRRFKNPLQFDPDGTIKDLFAPLRSLRQKFHLKKSSDSVE